MASETGILTPETRLQDIASGGDITPQTRLEAILKENAGGGGGSDIPPITGVNNGSTLKVESKLITTRIITNCSGTMVGAEIAGIPCAVLQITDDNCEYLNRSFFDDISLYQMINVTTTNAVAGYFWGNDVNGIRCFGSPLNAVIGVLNDTLMYVIMGTDYVGTLVDFDVDSIGFGNSEIAWGDSDCPTATFYYVDNAVTCANDNPELYEILVNNTDVCFKLLDHNQTLCGYLYANKTHMTDEVVHYNATGIAQISYEHYYVYISVDTGPSWDDPLVTATVTLIVPQLPNPSTSDNGKIVGVNQYGNYALIDAPSGGTSTVEKITLSAEVASSGICFYNVSASSFTSSFPTAKAKILEIANKYNGLSSSEAKAEINGSLHVYLNGIRILMNVFGSTTANGASYVSYMAYNGTEVVASYMQPEVTITANKSGSTYNEAYISVRIQYSGVFATGASIALIPYIETIS